MSLLVTASLLNSWEWYLHSWDDGEADARLDFEATLRRDPIPDNPAMAAGRAFEDAVTKLCLEGIAPDTDDLGYADCVEEVASYVRGKIFQYKGSKLVTILDTDFLLYGRMDAFGGAWIDDIKFGKSFEMGKYFESPQTKMYLELEDGPLGMRYLYADGNAVYVDEYRRESVKSIIPLVREFWDWLGNFPVYKATYLDKWASKY